MPKFQRKTLENPINRWQQIRTHVPISEVRREIRVARDAASEFVAQAEQLLDGTVDYIQPCDWVELALCLSVAIHRMEQVATEWD